ncbi:MAG: hypothetical protein CL840_18405 [Crocinitomicaceae bacterium]|nr:hypothetical protein [Crocinitomicaceae bacterium]|tara:strand:+ start:3623 stop:4402 length:780 start_codon:yes stop_codon:yes gene_type:complete
MKRTKWTKYWVGLGMLVVSFCFVFIKYPDESWTENVLQTIGTVTGIYLTLLVFLKSKDDSDQQFKQNLEHLQKLSQDQILAVQKSSQQQIQLLQDLNNKQIQVLQDSTEKQVKALFDANQVEIAAFKDATEKQINAIQLSTEKQIDALQSTTYEQISSFENNISEVTNKLSDTSILLAEILGRELEKAMDLYHTTLNKEKSRYRSMSGWKLGRTPEEREEQLKAQLTKIEQFESAVNYIREKYNQLKQMFGLGQKRLKR